MKQKTVKQKEKTKENNKLETLILAMVAIGIISIMVLFTISSQPTEKTINGVLVKGEWDQIKIALKSKKLVSEARMYSGQSELNSALTVIMVQVSDEAQKAGKELWTYAIVPGEQNVGCTIETNNCSNPNLVMKIGDCNCIYLNEGKVFIEGDAETLTGDWTVRAAQVIGAAMVA